MFQAIAAVFGFATSADKSATAQYLQGKQAQEDQIAFSRYKDSVIYNTEAEQSKTIGYIAIVSIVAVIVLIFISTRNKK